MKSACRGGFSLLELLLATSVLLGCIIVLAELAALGTEHVNQIEGLSEAHLICQSTLAEMLSGAAAIESFQERPVDGQPGWMQSADIDTARQPGLVAIRVTAWYQDPVGEALNPQLRRRHEFALVRWTRSPYRFDAPGYEAETSQPTSLFEHFSEQWTP